MAGEKEGVSVTSLGAAGEIAEFTESYASFNRIVNSLQRQYIELKEEFSAQNEQLAETNRKLVEMTNRNLAATTFLNSILNSISAGVVAVNQNGRITHFNPAASVMLGIPVNEPPGKLYRDVIPLGEPLDANALRTVETGRVVDSADKQIDIPNGTRLHLSVSTAIIRDDTGKPDGAVEVFHDLTKTKKMEAEIARLNTLAALGEMAATVAHQVRNPLAAIGGFASLLKRDIASDDPRYKTVGKIIRGVENLNRTVTTLLNYTRSDEIRRENVIYDDFLHVTVEQYQHSNENCTADVMILLHPPDRKVQLMIDPQLYRQLLYNILTNAIEAFGGKGEINISYRKLSRQEATRRYGEKLLLRLDETVVETVISDNGPGISAKAMESMFAPFFTTKEGGIGLGLAVALKIIKAHGGEIVAENIPEGGAQFILLQPVTINGVNREITHHER